MRIGRDHIASTVYTIAFAYAGAALPVLILVMLYERPLGDALTSAELSEEVIRTLVGSVGLVLAIPVTTLIAVLVVKATGIKALGGAARGGRNARFTDDGTRKRRAAAARRRPPPERGRDDATEAARRRRRRAAEGLRHGAGGAPRAPCGRTGLTPDFPHGRRGSCRFARI